MKKLFTLCLASVLCLSLLASCSPKQPNEGGNAPQEPVDLSAFAQTLMETHEFSNFLELMDPEDEDFGAVMLQNYLPGLTDLELEQMLIYMCAVSFNPGEFSLVQAKSADDAAAVKDIFQSRIDSMTEEGMNYPDTIETWSKNAQVVVNGCYVMLVCHEDCAAIVDDFNALFNG